jgi:hypothetical protein
MMTVYVIEGNTGDPAELADGIIAIHATREGAEAGLKEAEQLKMNPNSTFEAPMWHNLDIVEWKVNP